MSKHPFKSEVNQLLHLIIHSLYSHKEVAVRELISNASDALDKLKYLTITDDKYKSLKYDPRIDIKFDDKDKEVLTISDSGIGMNSADLEANLGTIANSGTRNFVSSIANDAKKDTNLIGQFGVGFYSAFMLADKVEVTSRKAGEDKAYKWISDGKGEYDIEEATRDEYGTDVTLFLNDEGKEFASRWQLESLIKKYSNHIPFPIYLHYEEVKKDGDNETRELKQEQVNSASALWKRPKAELTDKDYNEFYKTISHDFDDPLMTIHTHAEGNLEYATLFYIPKKAPMDLYRVDYKPGVKLYVKRVFITDEDKELLPTYLRFVRGIIDSEDLPLNVSRELLQRNKVLANIKTASVKKILGELAKLSLEKDKYDEFYKEFRRPLKEGLYEDFSNKEALTELVRFKSTKVEGFTSFADYKTRMKPDQKAIYYITGEKEENLRNSPLLEMYKQKEIEVLIMDDEIDEIIIPSVGRYKDTELKAVNRSDAAKDFETPENQENQKEFTDLTKRMKDVLNEEVKEVKISNRLSDSPSCIVADENDPSVQLKNMMKAMGQNNYGDYKPILEINPEHEIIKKLNSTTDNQLFENITRLLYEQAILIEGEEIKNPTQFAKRLNQVLAKAL